MDVVNPDSTELGGKVDDEALSGRDVEISGSIGLDVKADDVVETLGSEMVELVSSVAVLSVLVRGTGIT